MLEGFIPGGLPNVLRPFAGYRGLPVWNFSCRHVADFIHSNYMEPKTHGPNGACLWKTNHKPCLSFFQDFFVDFFLPRSLQKRPVNLQQLLAASARRATSSVTRRVLNKLKVFLNNTTKVLKNQPWRHISFIHERVVQNQPVTCYQPIMASSNPHMKNIYNNHRIHE